ncbi:MAG: DNA polymerase subunit beta [Bacteroidetes bacterium]|nr:MAG: DNA polymerase subunit beta [Bacteroidota bacterium]
MDLPPIIKQNLEQLFVLCRRYRVNRLYAFGSVITNRFDPQTSDLDFFVELEPLPPLTRGENLIGLWEGLEDLFKVKVDLITDQPIKNPYLRASIHQSKKLIYEYIRLQPLSSA